MRVLIAAWLLGIALGGSALLALILTDATPSTCTCIRCGTPTESVSGLCESCRESVQ